RATVLILSSDPAFARQVTASWPEGADLPEFVVLKEDLCRELRDDTYDLAVADGSNNPSAMVDVLIAASKRAILVHSDSDISACKAQGPVLVLDGGTEAWPSIVGILGREILRREQAARHVREAERRCALAEAEATLGRYMVEMRHAVSNALTSVLGNAELLLH